MPQCSHTLTSYFHPERSIGPTDMVSFPSRRAFKCTTSSSLPPSASMSDFTKETLKIASIENGVALDVWLFKPSGTGPFPLVIAGHGMTVIKDAGLAAFGKRWAVDAQYASLILDYRGFGASDGKPRNFVSLVKQREDYQAVITWARQRPELFLNNNIVLMGSALSGLVVSQLALDDPGLAGVMAHSPTLDGHDTLMAAGFNPRLIFWAIVDKIKSKLGLAPVFVRAVGRPGQLALLTSPSTYPGFTTMFAQGSTPFADAPNLINAGAVFEVMSARPGRQLNNARCPVLIVCAKEDDIIPIEIATRIAQEAKDKVTFVEASGGHFDIMEGGKGFAINISAQIEFLKSLLH
ncbi:alpha/beta-hydrolase [Mycena vitilis]|nr:alpha/beta-hydrolase [Mycena vitilis]